MELNIFTRQRYVSCLKATQFKESFFLIYTTLQHAFHTNYQQWLVSETKHQTIQNNNMFQENAAYAAHLFVIQEQLAAPSLNVLHKRRNILS